MATITLARTDAEIRRCFPILKQLRTHLAESEFVARVRRQNRDSGYTLVFLKAGRSIQSVAGFRISECLYEGRYLYVDDLATDESARSQGHGSALFDWLVQHARDNDCDALTLDSGVQRFRAHRFYLAKRMDITCHHFALKLK
jgi:GNAT superfamily N-acetyltransferase